MELYRSYCLSTIFAENMLSDILSLIRMSVLSLYKEYNKVVLSLEWCKRSRSVAKPRGAFKTANVKSAQVDFLNR